MSGEVAFGCAISDSCTCHGKARQHGSIVAAGRSGSGKILVDLSPFYGSPGLLVPRMEMLWAKHDPVAVVVNPKSHSGTLVKPLAEAGILVREVTAQDVAVAHGEFLDLVDGSGLEHLDQPPLTAAVRAAQQRPLAGAQAWDPKVAVDQGPLVAATLACWAFCRWEELATPGVWQVLGVSARLENIGRGLGAIAGQHLEHQVIIRFGAGVADPDDPAAEHEPEQAVTHRPERRERVGRLAQHKGNLFRHRGVHDPRAIFNRHCRAVQRTAGEQHSSAHVSSLGGPVRLSACLLLLSLAGVLGGAALIGVAVLGGAVIFVSLCAGVYALGRDDGQGRRRPDAVEPATLHAILERARRAG